MAVELFNNLLALGILQFDQNTKPREHLGGRKMTYDINFKFEVLNFSRRMILFLT